MMSAVFDDLVLSEAEIRHLTKYKLPKFQMKVLQELGIKAKLLRDNTVRVLRRDVIYPSTTNAPASGPKLKSSKK